MFNLSQKRLSVRVAVSDSRQNHSFNEAEIWVGRSKRTGESGAENRRKMNVESKELTGI